MRRVGYRKPNFGYRYIHYPQDSWIRSIFSALSVEQLVYARVQR